METMQFPEMSINLFDVGNNEDCLYSCLCCPCAIAQSRSNLDNSSFMFNMCCMNVFCTSAVTTRWLIRSAYGIEGRPRDDLINGIFCPCCSANQIYQTSKKYGNPTSNGGRPYNTDIFRGDVKRNWINNCLLSTFCNPCSIGLVLQQAISMPFWMGCLFVNSFEARNFVRYQYRIAGEDNYELLFPVGLQVVDALIRKPSLGVITFYDLTQVIVTMQLLAEIEYRKNDDTTGERYLTGYRELPHDVEEEEGHVQYEDVVGRNLELESNRFT